MMQKWLNQANTDDHNCRKKHYRWYFVELFNTSKSTEAHIWNMMGGVDEGGGT